MTIALCLFTLNEIAGCKHDIPLLDRSKFDQIYCIDGGSEDGTIEYIRSQGIDVYIQPKKGYIYGIKEVANRCKCDAFVIYHPKGTIPVEDTYKYRDFFEKGYELVAGSRIGKGAHNEEDEQLLKPRKWFVVFMAILAKIFFKKEGNTMIDVLHGFRGMTMRAFNEMNISDYPAITFELETCCRAYKKRIKRIEFPTYEKKRIAGVTHFKAIPTGYGMIKYFIWEVFRKD